MPDPQPFLSIVIPAHNEASVLSSAVASVQGQLEGNCEVILACNGCEDDSASVGRKLGVKVVESERSGMSFGKNLGGREARGQVLLFLDADSRLLPGALKEITAVCQAHLEKGYECVGTVQAFLESPTLFERVVMRGVNWTQFRRKLPTPSGAVFLTAGVHETIGGFDESLPQGTGSDLVMRARAAGAEWVFLWNARAVTSPRRFRRVGMIRQLYEWVVNVRLLRARNADALADRQYENIR